MKDMVFKLQATNRGASEQFDMFARTRYKLSRKSGKQISVGQLFKASVVILSEYPEENLIEATVNYTEMEKTKWPRIKTFHLTRLNEKDYSEFNNIKDDLKYKTGRSLTQGNMFCVMVNCLSEKTEEQILEYIVFKPKKEKPKTIPTPKVFPCQTYAHMPRQNKIYLSGPMTGIPGFNHPAFIKAKRRLNLKGYQVFSPHEAPECKSWEDYMRYDLAGLLKCGNIFMLDGWENSRGAVIERNLAKELGLLSCRIEDGKVIFDRIGGLDESIKFI